MYLLVEYSNETVHSIHFHQGYSSTVRTTHFGVGCISYVVCVTCWQRNKLRVEFGKLVATCENALRLNEQLIDASQVRNL